jgi:hypothetical protein
MKIIDNVNDLLGDDLKQTLRAGSKVQIAASCFSMYAYEALKQALQKVEGLEFIFTAPTFLPDEHADQLRKEHREFFIPKLDRERSLYGTEFEIHLRNKLTQKAIARECAEWIRRKAVFRSNSSKAPMQQFVCVSTKDERTCYLPIHGFSAVDLGYQKGNAVSNVVTRMDTTENAHTFVSLFSQIWNDADRLQDVTEALCRHIETVYQENPPERIYFHLIYNIFREFLQDISEDVLPNDRTGYLDTLVWNKLYNFQRDAATGIINKLETYNGCILADSVGLGKTFTALAVIKYFELRNKSVLVLCPKKLSDNWLNYNSNLTTNIFASDRFSYDVLCHTDLSRNSGTSNGLPLNRINWGNYDLVVIDESHNFRNNVAVNERETRYERLMNRIIRSGVKTKVLMLSATPVNNRFNDLKNQLALAYEGDEANLSAKLRTHTSVDEIFRSAQRAFNEWSALDPAERTTQAILDRLNFDFFELLDSVTIARSRRHITQFYDTTDIGPFPQRLKPKSYHCPLTHRTDVLGFNEIFEHLSQMKMAVYAPLSYILASRLAKYQELYDTEVAGGRKFHQVDREKSLQALMTTNLLKRLESSVEAFRLTLRLLLQRTLNSISAIENHQGNARTSDPDAFVDDLTAGLDDLDPDEDEVDLSVGSKIKISLADMDTPSWLADLEADKHFIETLLASVDLIGPEDDAKLQHLISQVSAKIETPINHDNHKVIVFTAFADTAEYLYRHLVPIITKRHQLHCAKVTGSGAPSTTHGRGFDLHSVLTLFAPQAKERAVAMPSEQRTIDVLIATDCISEGQNLQDCDYLINYDIHWNPVRIIQRFGRIDRIGSPNACIQLVNFWPDITLDEYINLKERVENRMIIADVTATGDDNVLTAKSSDVAYRRDQLKRLQDDVVEMEDLKTGVAITDLGLNDFRMDLLALVRQYGEPTNLPNGMHAVVPADPAKGLTPGILFALRNRADHLRQNLHNRLHPFYLIYLGEDGEVIANHTEVKRLLDLARTACKGRSEPLNTLCARFNAETDDGRDMRGPSGLLAEAINAMVSTKDEKDLESLFSPGQTTALGNRIGGLDEFELLCFIVVQEEVHPQITQICTDEESGKNLRQSAQSVDKKGFVQ